MGLLEPLEEENTEEKETLEAAEGQRQQQRRQSAPADRELRRLQKRFGKPTYCSVRQPRSSIYVGGGTSTALAAVGEDGDADDADRAADTWDGTPPQSARNGGNSEGEALMGGVDVALQQQQPGLGAGGSRLTAAPAGAAGGYSDDKVRRKFLRSPCIYLSCAPPSLMTPVSAVRLFSGSERAACVAAPPSCVLACSASNAIASTPFPAALGSASSMREYAGYPYYACTLVRIVDSNGCTRTTMRHTGRKLIRTAGRRGAAAEDLLGLTVVEDAFDLLLQAAALDEELLREHLLLQLFELLLLRRHVRPTRVSDCAFLYMLDIHPPACAADVEEYVRVFQRQLQLQEKLREVLQGDEEQQPSEPPADPSQLPEGDGPDAFNAAAPESGADGQTAQSLIAGDGDEEVEARARRLSVASAALLEELVLSLEGEKSFGVSAQMYVQLIRLLLRLGSTAEDSAIHFITGVAQQIIWGFSAEDLMKVLEWRAASNVTRLSPLLISPRRIIGVSALQE
ncbi:unnamed protein product [Rangifer tarandus platyrhynchus]|uniref:Uncharacterized protein n=1 Tax=Rangifer tarandus platyrhynchus TaxID=3082113 RepID=A0ABN8XND5_RANTA|nr:unnamed protein product [Rangifer tarandus platyrhynchus]